MADLRFDQLPIANTPLGGSEVIPLDQGGVTKQTTVTNIISGYTAALNLKEDKDQKGIANGYVPLNGSTLIDSVYLPSYVDDVIEVSDFASLPLTGETGKIYITLDDNKQYRWSGSVYVNMTDSAIPDLQAVVDVFNGSTTGIVITETDDPGINSDSLNGYGIQVNSTNGVAGYFENQNLTENIVEFRNGGSLLAFITPTGLLQSESALINGDTISVGNVTAASFIKDGGTASQFLKADGSVDGNSYIVINEALEKLITKTGTPFEVNIKEFNLAINDANVTFTSTNVTLPANDTFYFCYDLIDYSFHFLTNKVQDGVIWIGNVTTDGSGVSKIEQIQPELPKSKISNFCFNINEGLSSRILIIGDSLLYGAGTGVKYYDQLFNISEASFGNNIPNASFSNYDNYASGGQTSRYGMLWLADSIYSLGGNFNNTVIHYNKIDQNNYISYSNFKKLKNSPVLSNKYDLAIVGFGANGGTYRQAYFENVIKTLRDNGVEVIIITENYRTDNATFLQDKIKYVKALADGYGCAVADTWGYVKESEQLGNTTHADVIHMAQAGHTAYAQAIRTIINDIRLEGLKINPSKRRFIKDNTVSASQLNRNFPNSSEYHGFAHSTTGSYVSSGSTPDLVNPNVQYCGYTASSSVLQLTTGQNAKYGHSYAQSVDIILDGTSSGTFDVYTQDGTVLATSVSISNTGALPVLKEGILAVDYTDTTATSLSNKGVQIVCTSGTIKLYGLLFHTFKNRTIQLRELVLDGTWLEEVEDYSNPVSIYTDTINDSFRFDFIGSACLIILNQESAAGIVNVYLNGELNQTVDLYSTGTFFKSIYLKTNNITNQYDVDNLHNSVTVVLTGVNGSAISPVATNRRLGIIKIIEFDRL